MIKNMKKLILTIAVVLGLGMAATAENNTLFNRSGEEKQEGTMYNRGFGPNLPGHGETGDQDAPLTGGALLLIGFGAGYAMSKRSKK